jgi:hypothetical protein
VSSGEVISGDTTSGDVTIHHTIHHKYDLSCAHILLTTKKPSRTTFTIDIKPRYYSENVIYSPKKETQHVKKYNLLQIFNIILNREISITLH